MIRKKPGSSQGFTLLELALALALGTALITAYFMANRSLFNAISLVAGDAQVGSVAELVDTMCRELDAAYQIDSSDNNTTLEFRARINGVDRKVGYRLQPANGAFGSAADTVLLRAEAPDPGPALVYTTATVLGPRRVIANLNPYRVAGMQGADGVVTTASSTASAFFLSTPNGGKQTIQILLSVQRTQDAPIRYVRGEAVPRAIL